MLLPLIVITVVGHILVFGLLELSRHEVNPLMSLIILVPVTLIASLLLLPPVKGLLIGLLWSRDLSDEQR
ncbi:hypothetical protein GCM10007989_31870 [Devosia pacifica]|uniref:Uncharacterized protein n=1 Tax=Devosia pacifica TaxID=1335967 RepID=A0A918VX59_9HYPH|nr:hypothetical protein GCM10007989_31870 [Devosia pacifica]